MKSKDYAGKIGRWTGQMGKEMLVFGIMATVRILYRACLEPKIYDAVDAKRKAKKPQIGFRIEP
jgi:hypothetical protein